MTWASQIYRLGVNTLPKKDLIMVLSYFGKLPFPYCNLWIVFQTKCKLINFLLFKGTIPVFVHLHIAYNLKCGDCNATYYGKTEHQFKVRVSEYLRISSPTRRWVEKDNSSAIQEHVFCNHNVQVLIVFSILAVNSNNFKVTLLESFNQQRPPSIK